MNITWPKVSYQQAEFGWAHLPLVARVGLTPTWARPGYFAGQRDEPSKALVSFQKIVNDEESKGEQTEYGFKSLKQMTKLSFKTLHDYDRALAYYHTLLTYTKKAVTRNVAEKGINGILDYVSSEANLETGKMQQFYEVTMTALEEAKNEVR